MDYREEIGKWVVCHGTMGDASVCAQVTDSNKICVCVSDCVGWDSPYWQRKYVKFFESEKEAKDYYDKNK